jgi:hydroxyacylglutathione hydrolase
MQYTMLRVEPVPAFADNYIWVIHDDAHAVVVDPGDATPVLRYIEAEGLRLTAILCTHHHHDHVGGVEELMRRNPVPVYGPATENIPTVNRPLADGERVVLPELGAAFDVMAIPGHTRGHIAYVGQEMVFCGDTLFAVGCGRLFEGTPTQMHASLQKLASLAPDTRVYCGHEYTLANIRFALVANPGNVALRERDQVARATRAEGRPTLPSSIALEIATNPFLRCTDPEVAGGAQAHAGTVLENPVQVFAALREWKNGFR